MQTSQIIPALDLIDGHVVRLHQGDYAQQTTYSDNPIEQFASYIQQGAQQLHLVDLTGAKDPSKRQTALIGKIIAATQSNIQVGGGIRTEQDVADLLAVGAKPRGDWFYGGDTNRIWCKAGLPNMVQRNSCWR